MMIPIDFKDYVSPSAEKVKKLLADSLKENFNIELKLDEIHLERSAKESFGDWSSNVSMTLASKLRKSPIEISSKLAETINANEDEVVKSVETVSGFLNFRINEAYLKKQLVSNFLSDDFGTHYSLLGKRIMVEFAHPNPFKSFHIGHLRNLFLGEAVVRMLENMGSEVIRTNYQGDVGMHIAKCLWSFKSVDKSDYPETADDKVALLGRCYAEGANAFERDESIKEEIKAINKKIYSKEDELINELWERGKQWSLEKFHEIYARTGSSFNREYMESETLDTCMDHINRGVEKGILEKSEGAIVFNGEKYGMDTRVFLNQQGLPTYEGKELGLAYMEFSDFGELDLCIHNVAVEQISFFKVTFKVQELLDPEIFEGKQYHNAYEFVGLKKGKMSSRKGQVVLGNDILNEAVSKIKELVAERTKEEYPEDVAEKIAVGAVKYSFLKISAFKYLSFDLESSLSFEGDSGPYVQYTYARANSILESEDVNSVQIDEFDNVLNTDEELSLLRHLYKFPEITNKSAMELSTHYIANYVYDLCQRFNQFYGKVSVLNADNEQDKQSRLLLTLAVAKTINKALYLMGIETVEKM